MQHTLGLDKMLEEKKQDLKVREAALFEVLERGIHPQENWDLLVELGELRECLTVVEVDRAGKAKEPMMLVTDISGVLVDLGLDPIQWIPQVLSEARHVLEAAGVVLEHELGVLVGCLRSQASLCC
jgi:hypothetical protein